MNKDLNEEINEIDAETMKLASDCLAKQVERVIQQETDSDSDIHVIDNGFSILVKENGQDKILFYKPHIQDNMGSLTVYRDYEVFK